MKKILGLDLGTNSIGWALVNEAQDKTEVSKIIKLGVRIIQYDTFNKIDKKGNISESKNPTIDFETGKGLSPNAKRTKQRSARRNLQRFKQRRKNLIEILLKAGFITKNTPLAETGVNTTHQTLALRAKAAHEKITKQEFARVLLTINKKRGYKSSRKAKSEDEGNLIDGMAVAKELYENNLTPGQYTYSILKNGGKYIPDFYRSDLQSEFDKIWLFQSQFFPEILTTSIKQELQNKNKTQTWAICAKPFNIIGINQKGSSREKSLEKYHWRTEALSKRIELEYLAIVFSDINNSLKHSSGYLGAISDRSKELYFKKETVGEYLFKQIQNNPHVQLNSQVFYRQDYLDEFEQIWETQAKYYNELITELKEEIRDVVIFFQRKLKSQKGLISFCEFESWEEEYTDNFTGKRKKRLAGNKVIPKSSPLFQEFKIWQVLNNLTLENNNLNEKITFNKLDDEVRQSIFEELNIRGNLKLETIKNLLNLKNPKDWTSKYTELEGNCTNQKLYNVYQQVAETEGYGHDWAKKTVTEIRDELKNIFPVIGINTKILDFNAQLEGNKFDKQENYQLWHLLYSAEDDSGKAKEEDKLKYGHLNTALKKKLHLKYGFKPEYANMMANINLQQDYGNLSAKAIKKIIPFLKAGHVYSEAAKLAGYNHSHSLDKKALSDRKLNEKLELLKKNSLRNPVVEKILNQMVNLINQLIEVYGKPDEIRIELARELKKSAIEREKMAKSINAAKIHHEEVKKILQKDFNIKSPTRNDIIRFRLYEELRENGYKTLYLNSYIPREKLFSKEIDIEHIIPKAKLFDDSFSNKTLAYHKPNQDKDKMTAIDFISKKHSDRIDEYKFRIEKLYAKGKGSISKAKYKKLLMQEKDLPNDFLERDLRNSQYIAKKAKQLLEGVVRTVNTTTGSITSKLREDWDLINIMKELNLPKYRMLGLTYIEERKEGKKIEKIKEWTKRNDHRHHAMDALTVAFTSYEHVQYLNNLKATSGEKESLNIENSKLYGIKNKITKLYEQKNGLKKRKFIPPLPNFRENAKSHIESILISIKSNNKVVTRNKNKIKTRKKGIYNEKIELTPRGQLHKETIYGQILRYNTKKEKIGTKFNIEKINQVAKKAYRNALLERLNEFDNIPKKAFGGKNSPSKNPIFVDELKTIKVPEKVKLFYLENTYTIRKDISPELRIDKIVDTGVKKILLKRLEIYDGDPKKAFSNPDKNPIWLNKEKGICIKRVTITGVTNVETLHSKRDQHGNYIFNKHGAKQAVDFVSTGNNHHVAIYLDEKGELQDEVVSFFDAVARVNNGLPIIWKKHPEHPDWEFLFTMKQNEYFVFPSDNFNPLEIDLLNPDNASLISPHLFRVQKFSKKEYGDSAIRDYVFRHHLEAIIVDRKETKDISYKIAKSLPKIKEIVKVRINHLGQIVHVGEY